MKRSTQAGLRFRTRKLSPKQPLPVLREDQIDSNEYKELFEETSKIDTGVEKSEENEYHLQQALAAGAGLGSKDAEKIVPAPPTEESKDIKYDELYTLEFPNPTTYIRFSQTVEECTGCQYNMTSEDDAYLRSFNAKRPPSSQCSEDNFERIMEVFESTADRQAPFAAVDNTVVTFDVMESALKDELEEEVHSFAKDIYDYWRSRRQATSNKGLQPTLKFEIHQDSDDADPYVCFRRRDVRQTRKTRARDVQITDKLRRLRKELEEGRQLVVMAHQREKAKRDLIALDRQIFEQRAKVKDIRLRLNIKGDDEDLINQKPQKRKAPEAQPTQRPAGTQLRLPVRPDGRPIDADLVLLSDLLAQKENMVQKEVDEKISAHQKWNQNHVDLTREPLSSVHILNQDSGFRYATPQYLHTPPPSDSSDMADNPPTFPEEEHEMDVDAGAGEEAWELQGARSYRRRVGRLGRIWIDRRGPPSPYESSDEPASDRWKYDYDDDDEPQVYEIDTNDIRSIKFRATIPTSSSFIARRSQHDIPNAGGSAVAGSPLARPIPPATQNAPT